MRTQLVHSTGKVSASDSKTVRIVDFQVPPGVEALTLTFDYSPRKSLDTRKNAALVDAALKKHNLRRQVELDGAALEDQKSRIGAHTLEKALNNLMNVVLIDPRGQWRGRWDRNPSSDAGELVLSPGVSSRGFLPGAIEAGKWQAAIECHGVFGEPVSYALEVIARPAPTPQEVKTLTAPVGPPAPARRSGPGWYFGEVHSHTVHSDGAHELIELARRCAAKGVDFLCLTDHNTTSGLLETTPLPLTLIAGCELTTFHGHHPIYGLSEIVPWHKDGRVLPLEELAPLVRGKGGLVSVAHPFKIGDPVCTGCRMRDDLPPQSFDSMEVWYREWDAGETDNLTAYALWNSYWAKGHRIVGLAARDWHGPGQETAFPGEAPLTGVWAEDNTPAAILAGLRSGKVIMSGGPILDFSLQNGDVVVTLERSPEPVELRVFCKGERVATEPDVGEGRRSFKGLAAQKGWYRVEAWRNGLPRVLSNHLVVD